MIRICVTGARGRMGQLIVRQVCASETMRLAAALVKADDPFLGQQVEGCLRQALIYEKEISAAFGKSDVVVDFTSPEAFDSHLTQAVQTNVPYVCGMTGLNARQKEKLKEASNTIPIVYATNTSIGITLLTALVERVARTLGPDFDIEIGEFHHRYKKDAPSGTSLTLGEAAARGRGLDPDLSFKSGSRAGDRASEEIGFSVMRGGGVIGDHQIVFASDEEIITLSHRALTRDMFAKGALKAASWIVRQPPGLYSMQDVLGF